MSGGRKCGPTRCRVSCQNFYEPGAGTPAPQVLQGQRRPMWPRIARDASGCVICRLSGGKVDRAGARLPAPLQACLAQTDCPPSRPDAKGSPAPYEEPRGDHRPGKGSAGVRRPFLRPRSGSGPGQTAAPTAGWEMSPPSDCHRSRFRPWRLEGRRDFRHCCPWSTSRLAGCAG